MYRTVITVIALSTLAGTALAGTTSRDHRGPRGAPSGGVKVAYPVPGKGTHPVTPTTKVTTYGGITIRDHRTR